MRNLLFTIFLIPFFSFSQYGILDETFGDGGIVYNTDIPEDLLNPRFITMAIDPNDNIYIVGNYNTEFNPNHGIWDSAVFIVKYLSDGTIDISFGENGFKRLFIEDYSISANDFTLTDDGFFLIPISSMHKEAMDDFRTYVVKIDLSGTYDSEFGNQGIYTWGCGECYAQKIIELEDGNYLLAEKIGGMIEPEGIIFTKLNESGQLVASYANNGRKHIWHPNPNNYIRYVDFTRDDEDNLYGLSLIQDGTYNLFKLNAIGSEDLTLAMDEPLERIRSIEYNQSKLYTSGDYNGTNFFLKRYNTENLSIDTNFGDGGMNISEFNYNTEIPTNLLISNRVYQIGYVGSNNNYLFGLAAYTLTGVDDSSFGINGKVVTDVTESSYDVAVDAKFMGTEKILVLNYNNLSMACYRIRDIMSAENLSMESNVLIVPNPTPNSFFISGLKGNDNTIQIFDLSGKSIREFKAVRDNQKIELGAIPKGIYLIKINDSETKKLIVQ